jgi:hypothetical protein
MSEKQNGNVMARSASSRMRNSSPGGGYGYGLPPGQINGSSGPLVNQAGYYPDRDEDLQKRLQKKRESLRSKIQSGVDSILPSLSKEDVDADRSTASYLRRRSAPLNMIREGITSIGKVAGMVFVWYIWLIRNG